jgi:hypothetical protein
MPSHIAIQPGRLYPQPGYSLQIDKEGKWTATQIFLCHRTSAVSLMPRPGTPHPEVPFIAVSQVSAEFTEGDLAEITCLNTGFDWIEVHHNGQQVFRHESTDCNSRSGHTSPSA